LLQINTYFREKFESFYLNLMNQPQLSGALQEKHQDFYTLVSKLSSVEFEKAEAGKWSAAQQFDHIIKAVDAVLLVFKLPRFVPKLLFGKANRPSRSYEEVVAKYQKVLGEGAKAGRGFIPPVIPFPQKESLLKKYKQLSDKLLKGVSGMSESDLDTLVVPHPLLGKMTMRELLYFTLYHVQHHHKSVESSL
jgi:hypothetical protein